MFRVTQLCHVIDREFHPLFGLLFGAQVIANSTHEKYVWCRDFLMDGGVGGRGSCCRKDDDLAAWCSRAGSEQHPLFAAACDPTSSDWGLTPLVLSPDNVTLVTNTSQYWEEQQAEMWPRLIQARMSHSQQAPMQMYSKPMPCQSVSA